MFCCDGSVSGLRAYLRGGRMHPLSRLACNSIAVPEGEKVLPDSRIVPAGKSPNDSAVSYKTGCAMAL